MLSFFYLQPDFLKFLDANEQVMYRIKREKEFGAEKLEKQRGKKSGVHSCVVPMAHPRKSK